MMEIDRRWSWPTPTRIRLPIIGSAALMLQADYERGTKDSDILETEQLALETGQRLLALAGRDTELHARHGIYVELVASGLPFLPQVPSWKEMTDLNATLSHFAIQVLDVVDVVVSKLKRFHASDVSDIAAMVEHGLVPHDSLISRFRSAVENYEMDSRAGDLPRYVKNLHRVERDLLVVPETTIDLADWI